MRIWAIRHFPSSLATGHGPLVRRTRYNFAARKNPSRGSALDRFRASAHRRDFPWRRDSPAANS